MGSSGSKELSQKQLCKGFKVKINEMKGTHYQLEHSKNEHDKKKVDELLRKLKEYNEIYDEQCPVKNGGVKGPLLFPPSSSASPQRQLSVMERAKEIDQQSQRHIPPLTRQQSATLKDPMFHIRRRLNPIIAEGILKDQRKAEEGIRQEKYIPEDSIDKQAIHAIGGSGLKALGI